MRKHQGQGDDEGFLLTPGVEPVMDRVTVMSQSEIGERSKNKRRKNKATDLKNLNIKTGARTKMLIGNQSFAVDIQPLAGR